MELTRRLGPDGRKRLSDAQLLLHDALANDDVRQYKAWQKEVPKLHQRIQELEIRLRIIQDAFAIYIVETRSAHAGHDADRGRA